MNKQRQILVTVTYNELGCIIDTKAEPYEEPNLQPTCNQFATSCISRQAAIDALYAFWSGSSFDGEGYDIADKSEDVLSELPSAEPESLSDAYIKAVWTWLINYQIKVAELKGRYTPYEVLSWVANDWRKVNGH